MPFQQTVVWTAVPREPPRSEKRPGRLYLSVCVSPRFEAAAAAGGGAQDVSLDNFPDFKGWPALARRSPAPAALRFAVEFKRAAGGDSVGFSELTPQPTIERTRKAPATSMSPAEAVRAWQALFSQSQGESFSFKDQDLSGHEILTFSFQALEEMLKAAYIQAGWEVAADPNNPNPTAYQKVLRDLQLGEEEEEDLFYEIRKILREKKVIDPRRPPECFHKVPARWHWALYRYAMLEQRRALAARPVELEKSKIDLHEVFAALGEYPQLMRDFGLVFDLELKTDALTAAEVVALRAADRVRVKVAWPASNSADANVCADAGGVSRCDRNPWTACTLANDRFFAVASQRTPQLKDGMLRLQHEVDGKRVYTICQLDAFSVVPQIADPEARLAKEPPVGGTASTVQGSLPTLRSTGVALCWSGLAASVKEDLEVMKQNNASLSAADPEALTLFADDIVRGYAIDARPETEAGDSGWRSLCARDGSYTFTTPGGGNIVAEQRYVDEGWVSLGGTLTKTTDEETHRETNNLTVHETLFWWDGWSLSVGRPEKPLPDPSAEAAPAAPNNLAVAFKRVKGSLPRLRFGGAYRLRARAVDLAGNRLGKDDDLASDEGTFSETFVYGRFEPIISPLAWARGAKRLSNTETPTRLVIRSFGDTPSEEESERHIVPAKAAEFMAETHGMFDRFIGNGKDPKLYRAAYSLISKKDGSLGKKLPDGSIEEPAYDATGTLQLPYLPDPMARGAIIYGLPGTSGCYKIDFVSGNGPHPECAEKNFPCEGADWPNAKPFRIRLEDPCRGREPCPTSPRPPEWDAANRVLRVFLPKGDMAEVLIRSFITKEDVGRMGLWNWVAEQDRTRPADKKQAEALREAVVNGCHWMFTPCLKLTLVHALPKPARPPVFTVLSPKQALIEAVRKRGESFIDLSADVLVHGQSAEKMEINAAWTELIDDPGSDLGPRRVSCTARPYERSLTAENKSFPLRPEGQEEVSEEGKLPKCRHEFGDTKFRRVTYTALVTPRHHDCFPADVIMATQRSAPIPVEVKSAERPQAPSVVYVVPTFGWGESRPDASTITRTRSGGGLRVYFNRPWFMTGDDEHLGVVLYPGPLSGTPAKLKPFITQWGRDPAWDTGPVGTLEPGDFVTEWRDASAADEAGPDTAGARNVRNIIPVQGMFLSEVAERAADYAVTVLPHPVEYDESRRLWFADIIIRGVNSHTARGKLSHTPFIRLALARYQPNSLENLHVSPVALADFAQLTSSRTATVVKDRNVLGCIRITVSGDEGRYSTCQTPLTAAAPACPDGQRLTPTVKVSVEKRIPFVEGELGWEDASFRMCPDDGTSRTSLMLTPAAGDDLAWSGQLLMPDEPNIYRIAVKEYERIMADGGVRERLVYADYFPWNG